MSAYNMPLQTESSVPTSSYQMVGGRRSRGRMTRGRRTTRKMMGGLMKKALYGGKSRRHRRHGTRRQRSRKDKKKIFALF